MEPGTTATLGWEATGGQRDQCGPGHRVDTAVPCVSEQFMFGSRVVSGMARESWKEGDTHGGHKHWAGTDSKGGHLSSHCCNTNPQQGA